MAVTTTAVVDSKSRRKVKSGCKTCKIRKVKCDEGRPACHRCVASGRVCDGYGIWGGGGNAYGARSKENRSTDNNLSPLPPACRTLVKDTPEASSYLEYFKVVCSTKLPGLFVSSFWDTFLLQASLSEPVILNAVITLSAVNKRRIITSGAVFDEQEKFMLCHYNQAIRELQPALASKTRNHERLVLIACVVFVSLELLRGNFRTALNQLRNGLHVQQQRKILDRLCTESEHKVIVSGPLTDPIDQLTAGALARLQFQAALMQHMHQSPDADVRLPDPEAFDGTFYTVLDAWRQLEYSMNAVFGLAKVARGTHPRDSPVSDIFNATHLEVRARLAAWLELYNASADRLEVPNFIIHKRAPHGMVHHWMLMYHTMATIMVETCLQPYDENIYGTMTEQFSSIIEHASYLKTSMAYDPEVKALPGLCMNMTSSIVDLGWIPPLYYTAIKCRDPTVRLQAIAYLRSSSHREGLFDANVLACIAEKLVDIERPWPELHDNTCRYPTPSWLSHKEAQSPTDVGGYRACDLKVTLPEGQDSIRLSYLQRRIDGDWEAIETHYDIPSQRWIDGELPVLCGT